MKDISLRDYFAGQALAGICTQSDYLERSSSDIATEAYILADGMMQKRRDDTEREQKL